MSEHVIHFSDSREIGDVLGRRGEWLRELEDAFEVNLTSRDTWLKVEGEDSAVERVDELIRHLRKARGQGVDMHRQAMRYAVQAFREGREHALRDLHSVRIETSPGKKPIVPRTTGQKKYLEAMGNADLVFGVGPAGTGKTYLAMAVAVSQLLRQQVNRIILTRPAVEAGEALGFLPGDMVQKVQPYLKPLVDALHDMMDPELIDHHMERGVIEVAPLAYMRGRTLNNSFIILDEAQNTTPEQMMMFLTRIGFDSQCVVTGDPTQVDLPPSRRSGLIEVLDVVKDIEEVRILRFQESDVVRHELVQKIIRAYRERRKDDEAATGEPDEETAS